MFLQFSLKCMPRLKQRLKYKKLIKLINEILDKRHMKSTRVVSASPTRRVSADTSAKKHFQLQGIFLVNFMFCRVLNPKLISISLTYSFVYKTREIYIFFKKRNRDEKINILFQLTRHNFSEIPYFHCEQTKPVGTRSSEVLTLPPDPPPTDPP